MSSKDDGRIAVSVLMGGNSSERDVSLSTGIQIAAALDPQKYRVECIDTTDLLSLTSTDVRVELPAVAQPNLASARGADISSEGGHTPAVVFIALHGRGGEDGTVQGMLEFLGIPYTGSGVLASALAMNKSLSKLLFAAAGIPVAPGVTVASNELVGHAVDTKVADVLKTVQLPAFVKPNSEGSTFGCTLVENGEDGHLRLKAAMTHAARYDSNVVVEKYLQGIELTVGVLAQEDGSLQALPVIEIVPKSRYYDYESKYAPGGSEHIIPANIPEEIAAIAQHQAIHCHKLLGCRGMSRTDMIYCNGTAYVLEVNTIPGMTPTSLLPQAAQAAGIEFPQLLDGIIAASLSGR